MVIALRHLILIQNQRLAGIIEGMIPGFLFSFLLILLPVVSAAQPAIEFTSMKHSFGVIGSDRKAEHFFEFSNKGDQDLIVEKVTAS